MRLSVFYDGGKLADLYKLNCLRNIPHQFFTHTQVDEDKKSSRYALYKKIANNQVEVNIPPNSWKEP
jgi:hypothetical protein